MRHPPPAHTAARTPPPSRHRPHTAALTPPPSHAATTVGRLLEQQEDGTDTCVGVSCKPQVSSLAAASLGTNGILFGMLIVLSVGRSAHSSAAEQTDSSTEAALLQVFTLTQP